MSLTVPSGTAFLQKSDFWELCKIKKILEWENQLQLGKHNILPGEAPTCPPSLPPPPLPLLPPLQRISPEEAFLPGADCFLCACTFLSAWAVGACSGSGPDWEARSTTSEDTSFRGGGHGRGGGSRSGPLPLRMVEVVVEVVAGAGDEAMGAVGKDRRVGILFCQSKIKQQGGWEFGALFCFDKRSPWTGPGTKRQTNLVCQFLLVHGSVHAHRRTQLSFKNYIHVRILRSS